jgi:hypothetical protein
MLIRTAPPEVRDVVRRRIYAAGPDVQMKAFSAIQPKVAVWKGNGMSFVTAGGPQSQKVFEEVDSRYDSPVMVTTKEEDAVWFFTGSNSAIFRNCLFGDSYKFGLAIDKGLSIIIASSDFYHGLFGEQKIPVSFVFITVKPESDKDFADKLETMLVRYLEPLIPRLADAA